MNAYKTEQAAHEVIPQISLGYMLNGKDIPHFQVVNQAGKFMIRVIAKKVVYLW